MIERLCIMKAILKTVCFSFYSFVVLCACSKSDENYQEYHSYFDRPSSEFIAVFGDIQYYTNAEKIGIFEKSLEWIKNSMADMNILCVLHTGDITHNNDKATQWPYFESAMAGFAESIPFISNIGNHDYKWDHGLIYDRNRTYINEYTKFPIVTNRIETAFEEGRMENIVVRNEIHGQRYDLLLLEFGPRNEVVEWAREWVSSHPDIKYILMNHEYLEAGGGRRTSNLKCELQLQNTTYVTPDELWKQLVKCNDNIVCVLCGHVGGLYAVTYEKNDFGRKVCQIQHNIQGTKYRYDNWVMMWEFPEDSDEAVVSIVNAKSGKLYNSRSSLFTFKYRY